MEKQNKIISTIKNNNLIYFLIPLFAAIISSLFLTHTISTLNHSAKPKIGLISISLIMLFYLIWIIYSFIINKITKENIRYILKKDSITFLAFVLLLPFLLLPNINVAEKYMPFLHIPFGIVITFVFSLFILLKVFFLKPNLSKIKISNKWIFILIILYFITFSTLSILKHYSFNSQGYDLGIFDKAIWDMSRGNFKGMHSLHGRPYFGFHFNPIILLNVPFYWIYPTPLIPLVIQTLSISLSGFVLYLIAKKKLKTELGALLIFISYFLNPTINSVNLFDFHPMIMGLPFIFLAIYFLDLKRYGLMILSLIIVGLSKEHLIFLMLTFGIYIFFMHKKRRLGIIMFICSIIWLHLTFNVITPYFYGEAGYAYFALNQPELGLSFTEIAKNVITNPNLILGRVFSLDSIGFLILLFTSIGFGLFAILSPLILLLAIFEFGVIYYIGVEFREVFYQHSSSIIPFIFASTVFGILFISKKIKRYAKKLKIKNLVVGFTCFILSTSILSTLIFGSFTILYDTDTFKVNTDYVNAGREIISLIPEDAAVATQNWIIPHLNHREWIYKIKHYLRNTSFVPFMYPIQPADFIVLDFSEAMINPRRDGVGITQEELSGLLSNKEYGIVASKNTWILLERNASYEEGICKIKPFLNKKEYPYLNISIKGGLIERC